MHIKILVNFLIAGSVLTGLCVATLLSGAAAAGNIAGLPEVKLDGRAEYNGIILPDIWPPQVKTNDDTVPVPAYLISATEGGCRPEYINIDIGRQLFVDNFLIESSDLNTVYHKPVEYSGNPVFFPETKSEIYDSNPSATPISGGVFYDMDEKIYKMWYESGWNNHLAYAESEDGIHWTRPELNRDGSNLILRYQSTDSASVWIDYEAAAPSERYKLFVRESNSVAGASMAPGTLYTSADGVNWKKLGVTGTLGDRSTFFYNWFRKTFVFSIRNSISVTWRGIVQTQRSRYFHEDSDFLAAAQWNWLKNEAKFWLKTDKSDNIDNSVSNDPPQLYNVDAIAYESIMLGLFEIWYGPVNDVVRERGIPKITELQAMYSRDGFSFTRPDRSAFIAASRTPGTWNYGYVQSVTGGIIVHDDEIWIYHSGFSGSYNKDGVSKTGPYVGGALGFAVLRRDGFASVGGNGTLTTRNLTVTREVTGLYINTNTLNGSIKAELLTPDGKPVEGYTAADCDAISVDSCRALVTWKGKSNLSFLTGHGFKIKFYLESGELYSFWLGSDEYGSSCGAMGAGYTGVMYEKTEPTDADETSAPDTVNNSGGEDAQIKTPSTFIIIAAVVCVTFLAGAAAVILITKRKKER